MPFVQCPRCCKPLPSSANYCRRCGLPQNQPTERAAITPPAKSGGGGLRVLFFIILLIVLLKVLAWRASKPSREHYSPTPRFDRSDSSWRHDGPKGRRMRSVERDVIMTEPVEQEEPAVPEEAGDRPDH